MYRGCAAPLPSEQPLMLRPHIASALDLFLTDKPGYHWSRAVVVTGFTGTGKTTAVLQAAARSKRPCLHLQLRAKGEWRALFEALSLPGNRSSACLSYPFCLDLPQRQCVPHTCLRVSVQHRLVGRRARAVRARFPLAIFHWPNTNRYYR